MTPIVAPVSEPPSGSPQLPDAADELSCPAPVVLDKVYRALQTEVRQFVARRVSPEVVDDLVQEVFLRVHQHLPELRDVSRVAPWLFRIAHNVVVDHLRRRRRHDSLETLAPEDEPQTEPPEVNYNAEMLAWFRPLMELLPQEYRAALEMTEVEGLSQRELAERSGLSLSGAKSRVQRGRRMLEGIVRACCDLEVDSRGNILSCAPRDGSPCKRC